MRLDPEREKDAVDIMTNSMFSLSFLHEISNIIFDPVQRNSITVGQFYDWWLSKTHAQEVKIPYNLGSIVGWMYCGLLLPKENWFDLIPDTALADLEPEWGLEGVVWHAPKCKAPSIRYLVRRLRNALGHSWFEFEVPEGMTPQTMHDGVRITFRDHNPKDKADTFEVSLTLFQIQKLVKKLQSEVYSHIRTKAGTA